MQKEDLALNIIFAFLNIHRWLNIANITRHGPDDGSVEPKRYSVNFSINLSFHFDYLVINFSTYCRITIFYSLSYLVYMFKEDLALNNLQWLICHKTKPNKTIYI